MSVVQYYGGAVPGGDGGRGGRGGRGGARGGRGGGRGGGDGGGGPLCRYVSSSPLLLYTSPPPALATGIFSFNFFNVSFSSG